jgi:hypothetical protein
MVPEDLREDYRSFLMSDDAERPYGDLVDAADTSIAGGTTMPGVGSN